MNNQDIFYNTLTKIKSMQDIDDIKNVCDKALSKIEISKFDRLKKYFNKILINVESIFVYKYNEFTKFGEYFQIRWNEPMGNLESPYLYRWTLILFHRSIRVHHWIKSDDNRHFHDHSCDLISMIIKGKYYNVVPINPNNPDVLHCRYIEAKAWKAWRAKATQLHYLSIPKEGAWTILLCGKAYNDWGFMVKNKETGKYVKWRTSRYFKKFGIIQDENYQ